MKNLFFEEMTIISRTEKAGRKIVFSKGKNLIIGDNDVGKSTLIKSLYHTIGADTPRLENNRWKKANAIYCLKFSIGGYSYKILRDGRYFGLFNEAGEKIAQYKGISGESGIGHTINKWLEFNVSLETKDNKIRPLQPAYYFLPFYIDQDSGWTETWTSFSGLAGVKSYRKKMIEYHLGIRPQAYYDAMAKLYELNSELNKLRTEKAALISVRDRYAERKDRQRFDLDPEIFKAETEELVQRYNKVLDAQQSELVLLKEARNRKLEIESEIDVLERSIRELEADYKFAENPATPDQIDCPTCGTEFTNSIRERFGILDDIDYCRELVDQKRKLLSDAHDKLKAIEATYSEISKQTDGIKGLLHRKKESVTLADVIQSEGYKDMMRSISIDITHLDRKSADLEKEILETKPSTRVDKDTKDKIYEFYQAKMKEALHKLNVHVLTEEDYKSPERVMNANALGSDLPRSLLAQYFSFLHTMKKHNTFAICPMVIDTPLQQDQDKTNSKAMFEFIFEGTLDDQQLIIGTVDSSDFVESDDAELTIHALDTKYHLLSLNEYDNLLEEIDPLHEKTLQVEGA